MVDILQVLQNATHGGSSKGMSYWMAAARNGRKVNLSNKIEGSKDDMSSAREQKYKDSGKLDPLKVGTYYHLLHEIDLRGQLENEVWDATQEALTPEMLEALRLFRGYKAEWGSVKDKWGFTDYTVEGELPASPAAKERVRVHLDGEDLTGRFDGRGFISEVDVVSKRTGLSLPGPGLYLFDLKTAAKTSAATEIKYVLGPQAMTYMWLHNLEHPDAPIQGMIFDERTKSIKEPKSNHYFASPLTIDLELIKSIVRLGAANLRSDVCNFVTCNGGYEPCWFFANGICGGY